MSILESIKGEKKLSLNHWRYRLLHWAFNTDVSNVSIDNPSRVTGLPNFLYTHYCPLFHLTNLIAILSPMIVFIKVISLFLKALYIALDLIPTDKIIYFFSNLIPKLQKKEVEKLPLTLEQERKQWIDWISKHNFDGYTFDILWKSTNFLVLKREEAKSMFDKYIILLKEAREIARIRREKYKARIIFWTNFSRVFIKWMMNVGYFGLGCLFLYLFYEFSEIVWWLISTIGKFIAWLFTDSISWEVFLFIGKVILWFGGVLISLYFFFKIGVVQKFLDVFLDGLTYLSPPFYLFKVFGRWVAAGWNNTVEFVSMFYEENCPPIKLITTEESVAESIAQNGEET